MGQITRWVLQYRFRCRHTPESPALILLSIIIEEERKKTPVPEWLLLIYTDIFTTVSPICNFSLSATTRQKQAETVYNWTSQHYENKSLADVTCIPLGYVISLWTPMDNRMYASKERFYCLVIHVRNCTEGWKGPTLLTHHRVVQFPPGKTN